MANIIELLYTVALLALMSQPSTVDTQNIQDGTFAVLGRTLQPNVTNATNPLDKVKEECYWDAVQYMGDLLASEWYARSMYFSSGSFRQDYEHTWNLKDVGDFTMCTTTVPRESSRSFSSRYCLTDTRVDPTTTMTMAVCYPNSCTYEDISILVLEGYKELYPLGQLPTWAFTTSTCSSEDYPYTGGDILAIIICTILFIVIVVATTYDCVRRRRQNAHMGTSSDVIGDRNKENTSQGEETTKCENSFTSEVTVEESIHSSAAIITNRNKRKKSDMLIAFSAIDSGGKIMNTNPSKGSIGCLNGIRVLSMFWIILFHTWFILLSGTTYVENVRYVQEVVKKTATSAVLVYGEFGVEAFFVLGGLLVTYVTLKQIDSCGGPGKYKWWLFYLHRYWRLTPAYAFILMVYSTLVIHMGDGIWWPYWNWVQKVCQEKWWANMLYINNLYPFPGSISECMGWSWYLSVDMQLYAISPLFIVLFYKKWVVGLIVSVFTILCSFATSAGLNYLLGRTMGFDPRTYGEPQLVEGSWLYTKPYYRISQYLIGVFLGYVLFRLKGKNVKINQVLNIFLWCCSIIISLLVIYGPYINHGGGAVPQGVAIFYLSIHRFLMSACIGWVIFACATGNGGPVNTFLSWSGWLPLARVTYCAYLLHLTVIFVYTWGLKHLWYYTDVDLAVAFTGITAMTYAAAFLVTMAIEVPMVGLEKVLIPNEGKKTR